MSKLLSAGAIEKLLKTLNLEWAIIGGSSLERVFTFDDFKSAVGFVVQVAGLADKADHHPEVRLSWGKVVVNLSTHEINGLSARDFDLATKIDEL